MHLLKLSALVKRCSVAGALCVALIPVNESRAGWLDSTFKHATSQAGHSTQQATSKVQSVFGGGKSYRNKRTNGGSKSGGFVFTDPNYNVNSTKSAQKPGNYGAGQVAIDTQGNSSGYSKLPTSNDPRLPKTGSQGNANNRPAQAGTLEGFTLRNSSNRRPSSTGHGPAANRYQQRPQSQQPVHYQPQSHSQMNVVHPHQQRLFSTFKKGF